jgi:hypothetical protein
VAAAAVSGYRLPAPPMQWCQQVLTHPGLLDGAKVIALSLLLAGPPAGEGLALLVTNPQIHPKVAALATVHGRTRASVERILGELAEAGLLIPVDQ